MEAAVHGFLFQLFFYTYIFLLTTFLNSLHKSLTQEEKLRDQFNCTIDSFEDRLKFRESELQVAQRNFEGMANNLQALAAERNNLAMQLQQSMKDSQQERERADK